MSHFKVEGNEAKRSCKLVKKHKSDNMRWDEQAIQRVETREASEVQRGYTVCIVYIELFSIHHWYHKKYGVTNDKMNNRTECSCQCNLMCVTF